MLQPLLGLSTVAGISDTVPHRLQGEPNRLPQALVVVDQKEYSCTSLPAFSVPSAVSPSVKDPGGSAYRLEFSAAANNWMLLRPLFLAKYMAASACCSN